MKCRCGFCVSKSARRLEGSKGSLQVCRFDFDKSFFCDEEREGFIVSEAMKHYWAASLHTVEIFARLCKKHGLKWWANWGTLLGANRHRGFVPWDDDIDLVMLRTDYERFLSVAEDELPEGFAIDTYDNPWHKYSGLTVISNHHETIFDEGMLKEYYWCPFPVGFDLYIYDSCPDTESERLKWRADGIKYLLAMERIRKYGRDCRESRQALESAGMDKLAMGLDDTELMTELGRRVHQVAGRYSDVRSERVVEYTFYIRDNYEPFLHREWFDEVTEVPFETGSIMVPKAEDEVLRCLYGKDYSTPRRGRAGHNYPLYRRDISSMIDFLEKGGMKLSDLPEELAYIRREADNLGMDYRR